jgi:CubicO group peptidase (beta-lactamase class C family)
MLAKGSAMFRQLRRATLLTLVLSTLSFKTTSVFGQELPNAVPESVGLSSERLARLDAAMQAEVDAGRKAGIVTLVVRHGKVAHLKAFGMAERESATKMTTDRLFRLYSMTKPVTSVALLMLYEEGKFQLSDPLEKYIPAIADLRVFAGMDANGAMLLEEPRRKPTIHDVFRHTAGFTYGFLGNTPVDRAYLENGISFATLGSLKELVEEKLPKVPLLYHPGERWVYSVAHDVQAYLVEYFSGMSFDNFCRERIFEPLGMSSTAFGVPKDFVSRYTANYAGPPNGPITLIETSEGMPPQRLPAGALGPYARHTSAPFGGLSLSSTAMDYGRFGQMLVSGGELEGVRLLSPKTVELMTSNNLPAAVSRIARQAPVVGGAANGYGLGVAVLLDPANAGVLGSKGAFGWPGGATTWASMDPEEDMVLVLMTQHMGGGTDLPARFQTLVYQALID